MHLTQLVGKSTFFPMFHWEKGKMNQGCKGHHGAIVSMNIRFCYVLAEKHNMKGHKGGNQTPWMCLMRLFVS